MAAITQYTVILIGGIVIIVVIKYATIATDLDTLPKIVEHEIIKVVTEIISNKIGIIHIRMKIDVLLVSEEDTWQKIVLLYLLDPVHIVTSLDIGETYTQQN